MRIRWSPEAADDLEGIVRHIQKDNPTAALKVASAIYERVNALKVFPNIGRMGRVPGSRE
jgi:toxin ParE1/3/4